MKKIGEINNLPTEIKYKYSGVMHTVKLSLNKRLYPKHKAAAKRAYSRRIQPQVWELAIKEQRYSSNIILIYTLIQRDKKRRDRSNILTEVEKIVNDCLVKAGVMVDDSDSVIIESRYRTEREEKNKNKPKTEVKLEIFQEKKGENHEQD